MFESRRFETWKGREKLVSRLGQMQIPIGSGLGRCWEELDSRLCKNINIISVAFICMKMTWLSITKMQQNGFLFFFGFFFVRKTKEMYYVEC